jgi:protein TonB
LKKERKDQDFIKKPEYPGGPKAIGEFIGKNLRYPDEAIREKIEGVVRARVTIDVSGKVVKVEVIKGLGYGCDEEASRVLKLLVFKIPGNKMRKGFFHQTFNVTFKLPQPKQKSSGLQINYHYKPSTPKE